MSINHASNNQRSRARPWLLVHGLVLATLLLIIGWAGTASRISARNPTATSVDGNAAVYSFHRLAPATITPTITLTPVSTPPVTDVPPVYLPLVQRQIIIPGALSMEEVYTTGYDGSRQTSFRPCQAVVLVIRLHNNADIAQPATLFWRTYDPQERSHANLGGRRQVNVPAGESTWRFVGAPDLDALAGEYRFEAWFTSGPDHQALAGSLTVDGEPMPFHLLEGQTAAISPGEYDLTVQREVVPRQAYANLPVRITDEFTFEDSDVVQITTWEGVKEDSYVETHRFRPNGTHFGVLIRQWRDFAIRPSCVRRGLAYWEIDSWMKQTPGQWRFDIYGGETPGDEAQFAGSLQFTLRESEETP